MVATGLAYDASVRAAQAKVLARAARQVRDIRRFGSAALDLAWTAAGRYDAYFERTVKPWDIAAGRADLRTRGAERAGAARARGSAVGDPRRPAGPGRAAAGAGRRARVGPGQSMRRVGVEPTRPCGQRLLRPPRLPFRHRRIRVPEPCRKRISGPVRPGESAGPSGRERRGVGIVSRACAYARTGRRVAALDLDVPALFEAAHRKRDEQHLHGDDQQRDHAEQPGVEGRLARSRPCRGRTSWARRPARRCRAAPRAPRRAAARRGSSGRRRRPSAGRRR